ncbi:MAG: MFS transporter [Capsulimonadales bacterium]|nr:MFS transporter [Capsulimonadales bacterium]
MESALAPSDAVSGETLERTVLAKITRRLIPFIALIYAFNILDRTNIGIASLTMKKDLAFSDTVYGLGAGMFFIGYFFFEVPSNLILEKIGARIWIARIMFTWGAISAGMMFVTTPFSFYAMRFLLGVAEAGFYPGMILYLTYWFPTVQRAQAVARFVAVSAVVGVLGGPLSGLLLGMDGFWGLKGWQWLFVLEGLPSCLLGFAVLRYLTDRPEQAEWLRPEEREWLLGRLARERRHREKHHGLSLAQALKNRDLLHYCAIFFLYVSVGYGLGFFVPQIFKSQTNWSDQWIALMAALPGLAGAVAMQIGAAHSDRTCERKYHMAFGTAVGAVGVVMAALSHNPYFTLLALVIINLGNGSCQGPFWAMPTSMLTGAAAAGGIAFINSVGNLGGFVGPYLMGLLKDATRDYRAGLFTLAALLFGASILSLFARHDPAQERAARLIEPDR